jgi:hypothetical protein
MRSGGLVRLAAGAEQHEPVERQHPVEAPGEREHGLGQHPGVEVDDPVQCLADGRADRRVVVPDRGADLPGGEVEHGVPVGGLQQASGSPRDDVLDEVPAVPDHELLACVHSEPPIPRLMIRRVRAPVHPGGPRQHLAKMRRTPDS